MSRGLGDACRWCESREKEMNPPHQVDGRFVAAALSELLLKAWIDESSTIRIRVSDGSLRAIDSKSGEGGD